MSTSEAPLITLNDLIRILGECAERSETSSEWLERKRIDSEAMDKFINNSEQSMLAMVTDAVSEEGGLNAVDFGALVRAALSAMFQVGWECSTQFRRT